ncbi:MAG: hypothetical protein P8N76_18380 [Pirellulaceae bacterium]|nr:hypothetical protein [Pirellulaceae bacterium]
MKRQAVPEKEGSTTVNGDPLVLFSDVYAESHTQRRVESDG